KNPRPRRERKMTEHLHEIMDRNIFRMNLSVEATSAYILVTALLGENQRPSLDLIQARWTTTAQALEQALAELLARNVVRHAAAPDGRDLYYPNPASLWR
ncbi:MAG: hypothetical protein AB1896_03110, partial [Thermodesulfobacteriota bacterium]